jgi:ABC-type sugar transport system ATPase subunit
MEDSLAFPVEGSLDTLIEEAMSPVLSVRNLRKSYHAVEALRGVDLDLERGHVHAICGDNGAGKSTLVKLISGAEQPDSGTIALEGTEQHFTSPHDALATGIATIYQELSVVPRMAIYQNIFLGSELRKRVLGISILDKRKMVERSRFYLGELKSTLENMRTAVEELSGGQRQAVAISRALRWQARIIILDEPTAALGVRETRTVLDLIRRLRERGTTVVLVSHNMNDVVAVADRVTILRTGRIMETIAVKDLSAALLSQKILADDAAPDMADIQALESGRGRA